MTTLAELNIEAKIRQGKFALIEIDLTILLDKLDNIATVFVEEADSNSESTYSFPTRRGYVRDATSATPLVNRIFTPEHKHVRAINAFIRASNTLSAIYYVIQHKYAEQPNAAATAALGELKELLAGYYEKVFNSVTAPDSQSKPHFQSLEAKFHTQLLKAMSRMNLTKGLTQPSDFADLLDHYRNLSSLLTPAYSIVTTQKFSRGSTVVYIKDVAHPITKKTPAQNKEMAVLEANLTNPNFFSVKKAAFKEATAAFLPLLMRDDTALGAQTRYTIAPTAKNAFVIINEIVFPSHTSTWQALRTASVGYVGKGETPQSRINYAVENIKQLQQAAAQLLKRNQLYFTLLMTNHFLNKQSTMIALTRAAAQITHTNVSVVPINLIGLTYEMELSPELQTLSTSLQQPLPLNTSGYVNLFNRKVRTQDAASIINLITTEKSSVPVVGCASGQDRTATALEIAMLQWTVAEFKKHHIETTLEEIAELRARGGHHAVTATLTVPGALGMKTDSNPGYFTDLVASYHYRDTANANKDPAIDYKEVSALLEKYQPFEKKDLEKNYYENTQKISAARNSDAVVNALINYATAALHYQKNKPTSGLMSFLGSWGRYINKGTDDADGILIRNIVNEIAESMAEFKNEQVNRDFSQLMPEIEVQMAQLDSHFKVQQTGTVYTSLKNMLSMAKRKFIELTPDRSVTPPSFKP